MAKEPGGTKAVEPAKESAVEVHLWVSVIETDAEVVSPFPIDLLKFEQVGFVQ
jgi:hypothetical protein